MSPIGFLACNCISRPPFYLAKVVAADLFMFYSRSSAIQFLFYSISRNDTHGKPGSKVKGKFTPKFILEKRHRMMVCVWIPVVAALETQFYWDTNL